MTVIVTVKINDGVVMASDSASTFQTGQTYLHADKIVNLVKGLPVGVMVTGNGGIGSESIATLLKDLRSRLDGSVGHDWKLDPQSYTMREVADRVRQFLFEEKALAVETESWMHLRVCGYSASRPLPEIWDVQLRGKTCEPPELLLAETAFGVNWAGEFEALDRLILGTGPGFCQAVTSDEVSGEDALTLRRKVNSQLYQNLVVPAMPIQDAIDLARYLVETTIGFVRFSVFTQPKSVGGPIEIAVITKHERFRWVQRRHFYTASLNPSGAPQQAE